MKTNSIYLFLFLLVSSSLLAQEKYKFNFGASNSSSFKAVQPSAIYSEDKGYGFASESDLVLGGDASSRDVTDSYIGSDKPFSFSVKVPEGNYNVVITYGDKKGQSAQMMRVESRRMMTNQLTTEWGQIGRAKFTVNVRRPDIGNSGKSISLKPREYGSLSWDDQLTFEFSGNAKICCIEITPAKRPITIFLAGNSTVVDQGLEPYTSWGQIFPSFLVPEKVVVANFAESGLSLKSFENSHRLDKILSVMHKGDYLFIEFGHNDQKEKGPTVGAFTTYKASLERFIKATRSKGGIPVLITPMNRRAFDSTGKLVNTLGDYPEAVRSVAKEQKVEIIDLNAMTSTLYETLGVDASEKLFVHYPANTFPNQPIALADNTHTRAYGAYEIARCIVYGLQQSSILLKNYLRADIPSFAPDKPDSFESFHWPSSPIKKVEKPDGN